MATTQSVFLTTGSSQTVVFLIGATSGNDSITVDNNTCSSCRVSFAWSGRVASEEVTLYITGYGDGVDYTSLIDAYDGTTAIEFTAKLDDGVYRYSLIDTAGGTLIDRGDFLSKCQISSCVEDHVLSNISDTCLNGCSKEYQKKKGIIQMAESSMEFTAKFLLADNLIKGDGCNCC